jgi:hypothetical protein
MRLTRVFGIPAVVLFSFGFVATGSAHAAPPSKVDICHRAGSKYNALSISANALPAHLAHGDVEQPNGAVPGAPGSVFDSACKVVSWTYGVNTLPDPAAEDPAAPGTLFVGTGIPASDFATARNEAAGIELGFQIIYRQGPTVTSSDSFADGVLNYSVADGPQSTANGSQADVANRAAWNFQYSIVTGLNGATTDLNDFTFRLLIDLDSGASVSYATLQLAPGGVVPPQPSGFHWTDGSTTIIPDDQGNANVTQNSQNYAFYAASLTPPNSYTALNGFPGPATFDLVLQAFDGAQLIASNHIVVNVAP